MKKNLSLKLNGLPPETLESLIALFSKEGLTHAQLFHFTHNQAIVSAFSPLTTLFFLVEGKAKIYDNQANGKKILLQFLTAGDLIGELTLLGVEKQVKEVRSIGNSLCVGLPIRYVETILMNDPAFLTLVARFIGEKLLVRVAHSSKNQTYPLKYRLAEFILTTESEGIYQEKHTETAEYLGVSYRHLLFTLADFQEQKYLTKTAVGYQIQRKKLQALVTELNGA